MARRNEHVTAMPLSLIIRLYAAHRCAGNYKKITSPPPVYHITRVGPPVVMFLHTVRTRYTEDAARENMQFNESQESTQD